MSTSRRHPLSRNRGPAQPEGRLVSVDALRGFDMFWIAGGSLVVGALDKGLGNPVLALLREQLTHVAWDGIRFYDLIFPLFVFLVGVSIALAIPRSLERRGTAATVRHILTRGVFLFVIGLVYSGGISDGWDEVRWLGVLNRIAICYTATALLFTFFPVRALVPVALAGLLGYWAILAYVPIRDITLEKGAIARLATKRGETNVVRLYESTTNRVRGRFMPGQNVANHFDFEHLPGRRYETYWDPEGILSTLPAVVSCMIGLFAGVWLVGGSSSSSSSSRSFGLLLAGFCLVILGMGWSMQFPIIKKIWTSSFVLVTSGYSLMLLGIFHQTIDVWGWRRWCEPFIWIGSNALTIYLAARFLRFGDLGKRIAGGPVRSLFGSYGDILVALVSVGLLLAFARFLYRRKVFIRL